MKFRNLAEAGLACYGLFLALDKLDYIRKDEYKRMNKRKEKKKLRKARKEAKNV